MKNRFGLAISLIIMFFAGKAQNANDWIDANQRYFKISVVEDGLYQITQSQLVAAGIPISTINPDRFQIYRRGQELAINVIKTGDNLVSNIEFYGKKNDGTGDVELYRLGVDPPHSYYNLYTDTAAYFLTWKLTGTGKRMATRTLLSPTTVETYHLAEILLLETASYSIGERYGVQKELASGLFDVGEGWSGANKSKNGIFTYTLNLENRVTDAGVNAKLEILLAGRNNLAHQTEISIGPSGTQLRVLETVSGFTGYETYLYSSEVLWSDFTAAGQCVVQIKIIGFPGLADSQSISYLRLVYPQNFTLGASENKLFTLRESTNDRLYVRIATTNAATTIYDVTDAVNPLIRKTETTVESGAIFLAVDNPAQSRKLRAVTTPKSIIRLKEAIFDPIDLTGKDYLIISHSTLMANASDGKNPVQAYADYRGGEYATHVAEIRDVYNQFNYGDPSALAIKNFLRYALSVADPQYLFLIGKGTLLNTGYHRNPLYGIGDPIIHFVPTYGSPGSDALFSVGLTEGSDQLIPTGRLSARTNEEVKVYLDKVKEMEALPYDALWRKNLVQLSGGQTSIELSTFSSYINSFKSIVESDYLGGKATNRGKSSAGIDEIDVKDNVNAGVGMITFFGHSSSSATDIEIGRPSNGYSNQGKYPVILMNGCNGGAIFGSTLSFGEDWMKAASLGAVSVIAHSDFAFSSNLRRFSSLFYKNGFGIEETFGIRLGDLMKLVGSEYFTLYNDTDESLSQVYGMLLQGDPALKLFGADKPDYAISNVDVGATPIGSDKIVASSPTFSIDLIVSNFGKSILDSLVVKIDRTLSDGTVLSSTKRFERILYKDTLSFEIENDFTIRNDGANFFVITLDPENTVTELNEANNLATFELFLPKGNTFNLYPIDFGVVSNPTVNFKWQSADLLSESRLYSFEMDSLDDFSSNYRKSMELEGQLLLTQTFDLNNLPDSTTIYWRTRYAEPQQDEDTTWVQSSFTLIKTGAIGWGQFTSEQLTENTISGIEFNETTGSWEFLRTTRPIQVNTHGKRNANGFEYVDFKVIVNGNDLMITDNPDDPFCKVNTFNAVVFDKETSSPIRPFGISGGDVSNPLVCGQLPQMIHNFDRTNILGANRYLDSLITLMENGDGILLFSFDSVAYSEWDDRLKQSLAKVGVRTSTINSLVNGQPAVFLGKKGMAEGEAVEYVNNGSGLPVAQQSFIFNENVTGVFSTGSVKSRRIGPAKAWNAFSANVDDSGSDEAFVIVDGVSTDGSVVNLFYEDYLDPIDISTIDAQQYPYLDLSYLLTDSDNNQKPGVVGAWSVDYALPPEGILVALDKAKEKLHEGQPFEKDFKFVNISEVDFLDSLVVNLGFQNRSAGNITSVTHKIVGPKMSDSTSFTATFSSIGKVGGNNLSLSVVASETELYRSNNNINLSDVADISKDETNPVLDVTFDGTYILDGDLVSPSPRIAIRFRDDNQYLYKEDTSGINLSLKSPCEGCDYQRVNMAGSAITYATASSDSDFEITYLPGPLEDGVYQLRVQGEDESGNASGLNDYEISFEVINESSITHFYPYPNPFSTSTRFIFTLTGSSIPDKIKIQIMTVSGRVVREITQDEIGPLRIGNNITQYAWNGKDEFGDQLANGVYLYKVFIQNEGNSVKHRATTADRSFKNGFGKIYLLK